MNKNLNRAVKVLKEGGIVIFPTDTAFGVGSRIDNLKAAERLFKLRRRPKEKAVPVLVSSIEMAQEYVQDISPEAKRLMKKHWPGGLTIVLKARKDKVLSIVRGGGETVGIRMPGNRSTLDMIRRLGVPILAPSANFAGEETPFRAREINKELSGLVNFVLSGRCSLKKASTVVDATGEKLKVLREGAVKI